MALYFIFNDGADELNTSNPGIVGSVASGFVSSRLIDASRSDTVKADPVATGANTGVIDFSYSTTTSSYNYDTYILLGAHKSLLAGGVRFDLYTKNTSNVWGFVATMDSAVTRSDLIGEYQQDYVYYNAQTTIRGAAYYIMKTSADERSAEAAGLIIGRRVSIGQPVFQSRFQELSENQRTYIPPADMGNDYTSAMRPYVQVEKAFSMTWEDLTTAEVNSIIEKHHVRSWPIGLYDDTGDVIPWKFEHCFIKDYMVTRHNKHSNTLRINFLRLQHYENCLNSK